MKRHLKNIITDLKLAFESLYENNQNIKQDTIYLAVLIALVSLKSKKSKTIKITSENYTELLHEEIKLLEKWFPELVNIFFKTDTHFNDVKLKEKIFQKIILLFENNNHNIDNLISWMYQYIKKDLEKLAFKKSKKVNEDLLYTTQFFTDDYMVKYIVDKCLNEINLKEIDNIKIIDCASGGGNFLTYAFDKVFKILRENKFSWSDQDIVDHLLNNILIGYDLDSNLSKIASLSLFVKACEYSIPNENTNIYIFGGMENDKLGYLNKHILSNSINQETFMTKLNQTLSKKIFVTNPPFMGKRDMDIELKNYILEKYPNAKGDLCTSFIDKVIQSMSNNDILGVVTQNNWMYLDSFRHFRKNFLQNEKFLYCVDLGTNAFEDINGEKTNIALCIISKQNKNKQSEFIDLRNCDIQTKKSINSKLSFQNPIFTIEQDKFLENQNYEINYRLKIGFENILNLSNYSNFAKPMQGTSTGDNKNFIKYIWEVNEKKDWKFVSKGGGFSKWSGLNYHMVYWGTNAEKIKNNKGSALRNINEIPYTDLVYSDTGTLGLNVRVLKQNQVFIASGPGIKITTGNKYAHLAFLNSRMATFLLKFINPKFTISAGYISKLNVANNILDSNYISEKSKKCLNLKEKLLSTKLPNLEFKHDDYSKISNLDKFISNTILNDLELEYNILKLESQIENKIQEQYDLTSYQTNEIINLVGNSAFKYNKLDIDISIKDIDNFLTKAINVNCMVISKALKGYKVGSNSLLEHLSFKYLVHPDSILKFIKQNINKMLNTKNKYLLDLIHKIILKELNIINLDNYKFKELDIDILKNNLLSKYEFLNNINSLDKYILLILTKHHSSSFLNKPIFNIQDNTLVLVEVNYE